MTETHCPEICELEIAELEEVSAGDRGAVSGAANKNAALGAGPKASQQVFIAAQ
jgi:hypothetical protein